MPHNANNFYYAMLKKVDEKRKMEKVGEKSRKTR